MKKILSYLLVILTTFLFIGLVKAESISSIKMDVYVDSFGDAHVTEVWDAYPTEKTEYYHAYYNIGESSITDLKVKDEEHEYTYIDWDLDGTIDDKKYHYGYNYDYDGVELCFGKSSYHRHTYTLTYTIKNFVYNTLDDKQVMYWTMLNKINPAPSEVEIKIYGDTPFSDTLPVWGYGNYGGLAYVYDGAIYLSNDHLSNSDSMVFLAEFDEKIFNTEKVFNYTIDDIKEMAEEGATHYVEKNKSSIFDVIMGVIVFLFNFGIWFIIIIAAILSSKPNYGTKKLKFSKDFKKLPTGNNLNMFRDLPCNKDIKRAYWIAGEYGLMKKKTDFLGSMLLKWIKEEKVKVVNEAKGTVFKREDTKIVFNTPSIETGDINEDNLYKYMYEASRDGILENKEFERWCTKHYSKMLNWFDKVIDSETDKLVKEGKIDKIESNSLFKSTEYKVNDSMYEEAVKMAGLKKFFKEFDNMSDKEAIDVHLWEEYLMYAQIFGVAEKVAKQFKKLYPDVITDYDYNTFIYINSVSYSGISSASSAYSRAQSYSSGGGGFSSGGGGGGSFGGGGGSFGGGSR
ncbi:MAG: DUF2207 domain-containing protein [Bacilli bacterium]|nr:DUF2207 domain-containing protein [Bacilli bacterium]